MRAVLVMSLFALVTPAIALAQSPPPAPPAASAAAKPAPVKGGDITRDEYVEHAKRLAESRFDRMDTDHDGILTAEERRAWREAHGRHRAAEPKPQ